MSVEFVRIETDNLHDISRGYFIPKNHYEQNISTEIAMLKSGFILTRSGRILPNTGLTEELILQMLTFIQMFIHTKNSPGNQIQLLFKVTCHSTQMTKIVKYW